MDGSLRLGLILIAVVITLCILFEVRHRRRRAQSSRPVANDLSVKQDVQITKPVVSSSPDRSQELLVLSVLAKKNEQFASYDLLQTLSAAGLQFGEMNIFHYYLPTAVGRVILFSVASATEPGEFDLDRMGDFSCIGLTLFTNLNQVPDPQQAFSIMLKTAEHLAEELGGELRAGQRTPWTDAMRVQYQQKVLQHQHA